MSKNVEQKLLEVNLMPSVIYGMFTKMQPDAFALAIDKWSADLEFVRQNYAVDTDVIGELKYKG
jgi:hypothetical protein